MTWLSMSSHSSVDRAPARCLGGRLFCEPVSPSHKPVCEPQKIPAKKSKNGHNALIWHLLHAGYFIYANTRVACKNRLTTRGLRLAGSHISHNRCLGGHGFKSYWDSFSRSHARVTLFSHIHTELQFHHHSFIIIIISWCFSILVNFYFQGSFNLKVMLQVTKITQNTMTENV